MSLVSVAWLPWPWGAGDMNSCKGGDDMDNCKAAHVQHAARTYVRGQDLKTDVDADATHCMFNMFFTAVAYRLAHSCQSTHA